MNRDSCVELSSNSSLESTNEETLQAINPTATSSDDEDLLKGPSVLTGNTMQDDIIASDAAVAAVAAVAARVESVCAGATATAPMTKSETVARDVRRLKTATLDRMGKMLKISGKTAVEKPKVAASSVSSEDTTRKQKFNSLTRMLRFPEREDKSKSLGDCRNRSLTRILRKKATDEGDNVTDKPNEQIRGIFSRILGQIRGRGSKNSSTEKARQKNKDKSLCQKLSSNQALSDLNLEGESCPVMSHREA